MSPENARRQMVRGKKFVCSWEFLHKIATAQAPRNDMKRQSFFVIAQPVRTLVAAISGCKCVYSCKFQHRRRHVPALRIFICGELLRQSPIESVRKMNFTVPSIASSMPEKD